MSEKTVEAELVDLCRRIFAVCNGHNSGIILVSLCNVIAQVQFQAHALDPKVHEELFKNLVSQVSDVLLASQQVMVGLEHRRPGT